MKSRLFSLSSATALAFLAWPLVASADTRPDFEDDAKPILRVQPHLVQDVEARYEIRDTGMARVPGNDDHRPLPPYIFEAKPRGSQGPYTLRLLIQPGPPGRILRVVDITKVHFNSPPPGGMTAMVPHSPAPVPATSPSPAPAATPSSTPATSSEPPEPTSDTPSGPISDSGTSAAPTTPAPSSSPNLAPPADPAPH